MAQYKINDRDDLIQCPFDNTHMIRVSRMQYHIVDCKKNFPHMKFECCPFNARHWLTRSEMRDHMTNCPDRVIVEREIYSAQKENSGSYFHGDCSVPEYRSDHIKEKSGEDWDAECDEAPMTFRFGDDANQYFSARAQARTQNHQEPHEQMRLPHGAPQVLQARYTSQSQASRSSETAGGITRRLPNTLPMTANTSSGLPLGGTGRGRGFGTLQVQQDQPRVGGMMNGFESQQNETQMNQGIQPVQGGGRGRGYGQLVSNDVNMFGAVSKASGNLVDDDATSVSSTSSATSLASNSSRGRGRPAPRKVNAQPLDAPKPTPLSTPNKPEPRNQLQPQPVMNGFRPINPPSLSGLQAAPMYGLQGIGRGYGGVRPKTSLVGAMSAPQPRFIVPNVNATSDGHTSSESSTSSEDVKKQMRKYEKKLREIEKLEMKLKRGTSLNPDESVKLEAKANLLMELEQLQE